MIKGFINVAEGLPAGEKPVIVREVFNGKTVSSALYSCAKFKAMVEKYQLAGQDISGWEWLDESTPAEDWVKVEDAAVMAVKVSEMVNPPLTEQEQAIFIAGFCECIKWLSSSNLPSPPKK